MPQSILQNCSQYTQYPAQTFADIAVLASLAPDGAVARFSNFKNRRLP